MSADLARALVLAAGWLHFLQLPAMIAARRVLSWDTELAALAPVNRQLFKAIVAFIMLTVMGLGAVVVSAPGALVDGSRLGRGLGLFLAVFWLARAALQLLVLSRTLPRGTLAGRLAGPGLTVLYLGLGLAYGVGFAVASVSS